MFNFLKICGQGVLAIILSPLWISLLAIMAVYGLIVFFITTIHIIITDIHNLFVKDKDEIKDPLGLLIEDYEVMRIKKAQEAVAVDVVTSKPYQERNEDYSYSPIEIQEEEVDNNLASLPNDEGGESHD